jgi:putative membrane protein
MKYIKHFILYVFVGSFLLYLISNYLPWLWFYLESNYSSSFVIYIFLGIVSWLINVVLKWVLNILTLPISALTFGLFSLILNFILLYVFEQFVNYLDLGILIVLGNVVQVFVLSCVLSFVYFLIKKI